jgi:hypothetical protein
MTPAPIESFKNEMVVLSELGNHYYAINIGVRLDLQDDRHADQLRATLMNINVPMASVSQKLTYAFARAHHVYGHKWERESSDISTTGVTKEMIAKLLEPNFQAEAVRQAREVATLAAEAAKLVREDVVPLLSQVENDLDSYVVDYSDRFALKESRRQSWIPAFLFNLFWGAVDPTPWTLDKVQGLPQQMSSANALIRRLPAFLDNLELHFRRLSEIQNQQLSDLGYTTAGDLNRLYQDRILCDDLIRHLEFSWTSPARAFRFGISNDAP